MSQDLVLAGSNLPVHVPPEGVTAESTRRFLITVFKWWRVIAGLWLAFTVAAAIVMFLKPPVQSATAKVLFKPDRAALQISGLGAVKMPYSMQILQSEVELFRSREVLLPVARAILAAGGRKASEVTSPELEGTMAMLRGNIVPTAIPDTNVLQVTYYARTAPDAQRILQLILDNYMEQHSIAFSGSGKLLAFYEQEQQRAARDLRAAEEALKKWEETNNVVAVDGQIAAQIEKLSTLEKALHQVDADVQATRARIVNLEAQLRTQPERAVMMRERVANPLITKLKADISTAEVQLKELQRSPVIEKLRSDVAAAEVAVKDADKAPLVMKLKADLVTAEVGLHELLQRYTDKDRRVQEKRDQIANLKRELAAAEVEAETLARARLARLRQELANAEREAEADLREKIALLKRELAAAQAEGDMASRETVGPNPIRESLTRDLTTSRAQLNALTSQRDALRQQVREVSVALAEMREKKLGVERLSRQVAVARDAYLTHSKRLEDARITAGLDREQLANVTVIEHPNTAESGDLFKRIAVVVLAGFVGLGLGLAGSFTLEFFNRTVRTEEDVEQYLQLPVLAAIPSLPAVSPALAGRTAVAASGQTASGSA